MQEKKAFGLWSAIFSGVTIYSIFNTFYIFVSFFKKESFALYRL